MSRKPKTNATKRDKLRQKPPQNEGSGVKVLRDKAILAKALTGQTAGEIADDLKLSRQTVSRVLNSDEIKAMIAEIDARLATGIEDAVQTVLEAVKTDYAAARDLLRNFGAMRAKLDVEVEKKISLEDLVAGSFDEEI